MQIQITMGQLFSNSKSNISPFFWEMLRATANLNILFVNRELSMKMGISMKLHKLKRKAISNTPLSATQHYHRHNTNFSSKKTVFSNTFSRIKNKKTHLKQPLGFYHKNRFLWNKKKTDRKHCALTSTNHNSFNTLPLHSTFSANDDLKSLLRISVAFL